jgi:phospholipid-transporting ATPase
MQSVTQVKSSDCEDDKTFSKLFLKEFFNFHKCPLATTLAVGDGANDVNMITAAHVGIGIQGLEGSQAARSGDYSIGEFKILRKLILYYGRENYRRNAYLILYNFYKNFIMIFPKWWYGCVTGW